MTKEQAIGLARLMEPFIREQMKHDRHTLNWEEYVDITSQIGSASGAADYRNLDALVETYSRYAVEHIDLFPGRYLTYRHNHINDVGCNWLIRHCPLEWLQGITWLPPLSLIAWRRREGYRTLSEKDLENAAQDPDLFNPHHTHGEAKDDSERPLEEKTSRAEISGIRGRTQS